MNVKSIVKSNDTWQDILNALQSSDYGVVTRNNISELSAGLINELKQIKIDNINGGKSWNESIQRLQALIDEYYGESKIGDPNETEPSFYGDAGANYYGILNGDKWVIPQKNIDGDKYGDVRGVDKNLSALNFSTQSQFTIAKVTGNICRLIMPKYTRRVEVEDLDRNFWVIAQVISDITDDIFKDNIRYSKIFNGILDEIVQLWENLAYLWAAAGLVGKSNKTITIWQTIQISPSTSQLMLGYKNYDDFDINWIENKKTDADGFSIFSHLYNENHIRYLFDTYSNTNIIFVPFVRSGNYKGNFFHQLIMPGILFYNFKSGTNYIYDFVNLTSSQLEQIETSSQEAPDYNSKNLIYLDMKDKAILKKIPTSTEASYSKIMDFKSNITNAKYSCSGISYNSFKIVPKVEIADLDTINNFNNTHLFSLQNSVYEIKVKGTTYNFNPVKSRVIKGYRVGVINLTFSSEDISTSMKDNFLGDSVSYYAD